jgi:hypothetical protein
MGKIVKGFASLLIIAALCLGLSSPRAGPAQAKPQIHAYTNACPEISAYFSYDKITSKWDVAEKPFLRPDGFGIRLEPAPKYFPPADSLTPLSPKHSYWLGLGCGGLPS